MNVNEKKEEKSKKYEITTKKSFEIILYYWKTFSNSVKFYVFIFFFSPFLCFYWNVETNCETNSNLSKTNMCKNATNKQEKNFTE